MSTLGIIGTGEIGWRVGRLLREAGHRVIAYDIRAEARRRAADAGLELAPDAARLAREAETVITCVTDGRALRDVIVGGNGILDRLAHSATVVDLTSAEPWVSTELGQLLAGKGIGFLDAPVSGGVAAAEAGRLNFMVGGERDVLDRVRPILALMGPTVAHVGPVGSGHAMKAINMLAMAGGFMATAETLACSEVWGIPAAGTIEHLNRSAAGSFVTRVHFPRYVLAGTFASGFTFDLMIKDLAIGIELARRNGLAPLMAQRVFDLYCIARNLGYAGKDNTRIADLVLTPGAHRLSATKAAMEPRGDNGIDAPSDAEDILRTIARAAAMVVGGEAILIGAKAGLDPRTVVDVLNAGSGGSDALAGPFRACVLPRRFDSGTPLRETYDALVRGTRLAHSAGIGSHLLDTTTQVYAAALALHGPKADETEVFSLLESWAGITLPVHLSGAP